MPNPTPKHPPVKLTKTYIDKVKPGSADEFHWDAEIKGFGLRVNPSGKLSFVVQGRVDPNKPAIRIGIGAYGVFTCDEARDVAREHLRSMRMGIDPRDLKRQDEAMSITLRQVADAYLSRPNMLKASTRELMNWHVDKVFEKWLTRPIASITTTEVRRRYEEVATKGLRGKKAAPGSASLAMVTLRTLMNFARSEYRKLDGTPILDMNPVDILKRELRPAAPRTRHIDRKQIGKFWNLLTTARQNPAFSADTLTALDLVQFILLTGARRNEGAALEWRNVHLEEDAANCSWHIEDPKNKNPITLPLSSQAVAVLKARKAADDRAPVRSKFVFPSRGKTGHIMDTRAPLERFSVVIGMDRLSAHDLRRTFVTTGVKACRLDIAKLELLTNHVPQTVTTRHYLETSDLRDYHPEVEAIGNFIENEGRVAAAKASGANVVTLALPA
jgi:integrase